MRSAIDTSVLSALWSQEPTAGRMAAWLDQARRMGELVVSAPVHAELLVHPGADRAFVEHFLEDTGIRVDYAFGEEVWVAAGDAYASYEVRREHSGGGEPKRVWIDFVVGAHALLKADRLLTLDADRYRSAYPELVIEGSSHLA